MGIHDVIRGDDHTPSNTPPDYGVRALGAPVPTFAHISMILGLTARNFQAPWSIPVEEYRDQGYLADAFVNYLPSAGRLMARQPLFLVTFWHLSSLDHVSKNPAKSGSRASELD